MRDYASLTIQPEAGLLKTSTDDRNTPMGDIEAHPDYWSCVLHDDFDVKVEITATMHCAIFRATYLEAGEAHILVDAHFSGETEVHFENNEIIVRNVQHGNRSSIEGLHVVEFNTPFLASSSADGQFAHADYAVNQGDVILFKVGTSYISHDQARANLETEIPDWDFDQIRTQTHEIWNRELGKIEVEGGTEDQRVNFYTGLYHCLLVPRVFSEHGRYYSAFDSQVHSCTDDHEHYNDFSLWDTYRSEHSLLCLIAPEYEEGMCQAMVDMGEQGGWIPKWPNPGYSGVMIGTHSDSVIAETYLKGLTNFDIQAAYDLSYKHATQPAPPFYEARGGGMYYIDLGYVPADMFGEATSRTLEFAYDDYSLAQLAKALGREDDYTIFMARAYYYINVYDSTAPGEFGNPNVGYVRGRNSDGSWTDPGTFSPTSWYRYITEGCPYQYTWYVPHDVQGLINLMGGRDNFNAKLDYFFEHSKWTVGSDYSNYYWHGNEPSQHDVYLYDWSGQPWKTQELARKTMETRYWNITGRAGGLCGNDDCGQTSSWYIFSAMGFYPVCPAGIHYEIGSPIFDKVTIHLPEYHYGGKDFTIIAHNNSAENMYIQSATLNGEPLDKPWFTHSDLAEGGTLVFEMGPNPNYEWGSDPVDAPPSMSTSVLEPVEFEYSNLKLSDNEVKANEPFEVSATVKNIGGVGSENVQLYVNGSLRTSKKVFLAPGENKRVSFTLKLYEPGFHAVTIGDLLGENVLVENIRIDNYAVPWMSRVGEPATMSVVFTNLVTEEQTENVGLYIDNELVDSQEVTLAPSEPNEVSFEWIFAEPGEYMVTINGLEPKVCSVGIVRWVDNDWVDRAKVPENLVYGENAFASITEALDAAFPSGEILVNPGTYDDAIENFPITIDKPMITLKSTRGAEDTIIEGGGVVIVADYVAIDGFKVGGAGKTGITVYSHNNTIKNNIANSNDTGISLKSSSSYNTIDNNICELNSGYGIFLSSSSNNTITNNICNSNGGAGIWLEDGCSATMVENNTCSGNALLGILVYMSNDCTISNNTTTQSGVGITLIGLSNGTVSNNISSFDGIGIILPMCAKNEVSNNFFGNNSIGAYLFIGSSNNEVSNNSFKEDSIGILICEGLWEGLPSELKSAWEETGITEGDICENNSIHYNNFEGCTTCILNQQGAAIDASLNWWGDTHRDEIAKMIVGNVVFYPWLDEEGNPLIDNTPPEDFGLTYPGDGANILNLTPTLEWQASSDALTGLDHYAVWVDGVNVDNTPVGTTSYTASPLSLGSHTWYVVAVDGAGNEHQSESTFTFTVVTPAEFVVENLVISPENVALGENVTISVDVVNIGEVADSTLVELRINGEVVDNQIVLLISGESKPVSFTVVRNEPGSYAVSVDGLTGNFEAVPPEGIPVWTIAVAIIVILAAVGGILYRRRR